MENVHSIIASFCPAAVLAAYDAGEAILSVYSGAIEVEYKDDKSPLTAADKASNKIIMERLQALWSLPVLSEESKAVPYESRRDWDLFWLVDPLDGTKEFIKRNGEFTVNIALIHKGRPVYGVVYSPILGVFYLGAEDLGARKVLRGRDFQERDELEALLHDHPEGHLEPMPNVKQGVNLKIVASRSHCSEETLAFVESVRSHSRRPVDLVSIGSSLKLCLVAEGSADIYPRLAPTMEWDTGAAHAVASAAGCRVVDYGTGQELVYNKPNLTNPFFVVYPPAWPKQLE